MVELEKKKSEIMAFAPETLKPVEKDEVIRRASSQFDMQSTLLK